MVHKHKTWEKIREFSFRKWFRRLYLIFVVGFLIGFRPSDAFIYELYLSPSKEFDGKRATEDVLPIRTYSFAVQAVIVFLAVEVVNWNIFLGLFCSSAIVVSCLLAWTESLLEAQVAEGIFGTFLATELVYNVFVYAHSDVTQYQIFTSFARAAPLLGRSLSAFLGQLLIWQKCVIYRELSYISLAFAILALLVTLTLELTRENIYYEENEKRPKSTTVQKLSTHFIRPFSDKYMVKWCLWSALAMAGYLQVQSYVQPLYKAENSDAIYNGSVEGVAYLFAFAAAVLAGFFKILWRFNGDLFMTITSLVQAFMLIFTSQIQNEFLCYLFYVIFCFMYHFTQTAVSAEIASNLKNGSFGLIFGCIAAVGAICNSFLVGIVNDDIGFDILVPKDEFMVYGAYHLGISFLYIAIGLASWYAKRTYY